MIALLLGGPLNAAPADGSLDTRINFGDPLRTRLIVEGPKALFISEARIIVWTSWADESSAEVPLYLVATDTPGFALGPLSLTGGLRELGNPHPRSARGSAWLQPTGARLDAGIDPGARRGVSVSPRFLPVGGSVIQTDDGLAVAASIGSWFTDGVKPDRSWAELTAAASRPAALLADEPAEIGWFERVPMPVDIFHLLCRGRFPVAAPASAIEFGPALGVSLAETLPPGWWLRLAVHAESATALGSHAVELEAAGISSISSVHYRLPYAKSYAEAAVVALAVRADLSGQEGVSTVGVSAAGRFAMAWRPEAAVPGVAFTLRGLEPDDAGLEVGTYATTGRWRFSLEAALDADRQEVPDVEPGVDVSTGSSVRPASLAGEWLMAVEYKLPAHQVLSPGIGVTLELAREAGPQPRSLQLTGAGGLQLGPIVSGSARLFDLSGTVYLGNDDGPWDLHGAAAECRLKFHVGTAEYRARLEVEWDRNSDDPITFDAELGWTVRTATSGE